MITNTTQGQKSLALLLDEIEQGAKDAGIPDLFKLRKTQGLLVKALRRAMQALEEPEAVSDNVDSPRQNELLPCPFDCGTGPRVLRCDELGWTPLVRCDHCSIDWKTFEAWNKRAGQSVSDGGGSSASGVSSSKVLSEITAILEGKEQQNL